MDLLVTGQRLQIFLDDPTKAGEVATQPVEPTGDWFVGARACHIAKTIGAALAHWAEPEEAAVTEQKLQVGEAARTDRR